MSINKHLLLTLLCSITFTISTKVIDVDSKSFNTIIMQSEIPVILDVYATWCGPCRTMAPIFEQVSKQFEGKVLFAKMDYDKSEKLAQRLKVTSLPSFLIYNQGNNIKFIKGSLGEEKLHQLILEILK